MKELGWYHTGDVWADRNFDEAYENIPDVKPSADKPLSSYCFQLCETIKGRFYVRLQKGGSYGAGVWHIWITRPCEYNSGMKLLFAVRAKFPAINKENRDAVFKFIKDFDFD